MGIFDDAIREHLELKRRHGAGGDELRKLEDEAFGPPGRPDEPTAQATVAEAATTILEDDGAPAVVEEPTEPPAEHGEPLPEPVEAPGAEPVDFEAALTSEPGDLEESPDPAIVAEEPTAMEHSTVKPDPSAPTSGVETEEHPPPEPPDEQEGAEAEGTEDELAEDEFFSEQSLSDELDQALDAPNGDAAPASDRAEIPPAEFGEPPLEPAEQEGKAEDGSDDAGDEGEDVLEETPEFLQDSPEHDRLWFEQKPPKDFDFDD